MVDRTLGIDLASQAENTAVCVIAWSRDRAEVELFERGRSLDDERLLDVMLAGPSKIGIDAPLGWPIAFVRAIQNLDTWPLLEETPTAALAYRACDHWIRARMRKVPLSVSTDRIAYPAMRAARLLRRYQDDTGTRIDRTGMSGPVAEVYPDTAVTQFGLRPDDTPRLSYKGDAGRDARERLLERLMTLAPWLGLAVGQPEACVASDDHFDALIAALIARAVQRGGTYPPPSELASSAEIEGWIHLPCDGALGALIGTP